MKILELLLPPGMKDKSLSKKKIANLNALQQRMDKYVDMIGDPSTPKAKKGLLQKELRKDYTELKATIESINEIKVMEAVHKLPISNEDFDLVEEIMSRPIPACVAEIFLQDIIRDDAFSDELRILEDTEPNRDVRPMVAEWFKRVMPDQMYRFTDNTQSKTEREGILSPIHGYDDKAYHGTNEPLTGNAYGRL
jgi:hypothetical protein